jgi:hypothetical protein
MRRSEPGFQVSKPPGLRSGALAEHTEHNLVVTLGTFVA